MSKTFISAVFACFGLFGDLVSRFALGFRLSEQNASKRPFEGGSILTPRPRGSKYTYTQAAGEEPEFPKISKENKAPNTYTFALARHSFNHFFLIILIKLLLFFFKGVSRSRPPPSGEVSTFGPSKIFRKLLTPTNSASTSFRQTTQTYA